MIYFFFNLESLVKRVAFFKIHQGQRLPKKIYTELTHFPQGDQYLRYKPA